VWWGRCSRSNGCLGIWGILMLSVLTFRAFDFYGRCWSNLSDLTANEPESCEEEDAYFMSHYKYIIINNSKNLVLSTNKNKFSVYSRTYPFLRVFRSNQQFPPPEIRRSTIICSVFDSKCALCI
jgi:hypothetical protein